MRTLTNPSEIPLEGIHLVEASAGSGKTYTLVELALRFLREDFLPRQLLVVTYTRAATAELKLRFRARLLQEREQLRGQGRETAWVARALARLDEMTISTLHGFCQRALMEFALSSREALHFDLVADLAPHVLEVATDLFVRRTCELDADGFAECIDSVARARPEDLARLISLRRARPVLAPVRGAMEDGKGREEALARALRMWRDRREEIITHLGAVSPRRATHEKHTFPLLDAGRLPPRSKAAGKLREAVGRLRKEGIPLHPFLELIEAARPDLPSERPVALREEAFQQGPARLTAHLGEQGLLGFEDLLHRLLEALRGPGGEELAATLRQRYRVALVDEFQDTDPIQAEILERVFAADAPPRLYYIGDPKQAIYGFRGADVHAYLATARRVEEGWTLGRNYRSDPSLLRGVEALFGNQDHPFRLPGVDFVPVEAREDRVDRLRDGKGRSHSGLALVLTPACANVPEAKETVARVTAERVLHLLAAGLCVREDGSEGGALPITPGSFAVLTRTNELARKVQDALRQQGIPSVLDGDRSVFESEEAETLAALLGALLEPERSARLRAALATEAMGFAARDLQAVENDDAAWDVQVQRFREWARRWRDKGIFAALRAWMEEAEVLPRLLSRTGGDRAVTNLLHLQEILEQIARRHALGPWRLREWFNAMRAGADHLGEMASEDVQLRLEGREDAVRITTIHRSKGLEYPIVLCPTAWKEAGGDPSREVIYREDGAEKLVLARPASEEQKRAMDDGERGENLRLLYVALTRAAHRCEVLWGALPDIAQSAFAWLLSGEPLADPAALAAWSKDLAKRVKQDPASYEAEVEAFARKNAGAIEVVDQREAPPPPPHVPEVADPRDLEAAPGGGRLPIGPRTASFSGLVRQGGSKRAEEGRDDDENVPSEPAALGRGEAPSPPAGALAGAALPAREDPVELPLAGLPPGAATGILVHAILEHADFREEESLRAAAVRALRLQPEREERGEPEAALAGALHEAMGVPVPDPGHPHLVLQQARPEERGDEFEFFLSTREGHGLSAAGLARALRECRWPHPGSDLAERVAGLSFSLEGWLHGFIDLVVTQHGRWHVVDYKTNHLGDTLDAYRVGRLAEVVADHHYDLQLLFYGFALHAHLKARLRGYRPERDLAGGHLLFLRGRVPGRETGRFSVAYPSALLERMERLFGLEERP